MTIPQVATGKTFNLCFVPYTFYSPPCFLYSEYLTVGGRESNKIYMEKILGASVFLVDLGESSEVITNA